MNITKILNTPTKRSVAAWAVGLPLVFGIGYCESKHYENEINNYKNEVYSKYSLRFNKINSKIKYNDNLLALKLWQDECNKMNDSIKIDSIVQKAYFEGAQKVRDSIKNASK